MPIWALINSVKIGLRGISKRSLKSGETHPSLSKGDEMGAAASGGGGGVPGWAQPALKWGLLIVLAFVVMSNADAPPRAINSFFCGFGVDRACQNVVDSDQRRAANRAAMIDTAIPPPPAQQRGFTIGGELNRRMHGGQPPPQRRTTQAQRGLMPSIDCAARGGVRTVNPSTGMPSCFVPN